MTWAWIGERTPLSPRVRRVLVRLLAGVGAVCAALVAVVVIILVVADDPIWSARITNRCGFAVNLDDGRDGAVLEAGESLDWSSESASHHLTIAVRRADSVLLPNAVTTVVTVSGDTILEETDCPLG